MKRRRAIAGIAVLASGALAVTVALAASAGATTDVARGPDNAMTVANRALAAHKPAIRAAAAGETFTTYSSKVDANGAAHVRYTRTYQGLRVAGGDFVVHTATDGAFAGASVGLTESLSLPTVAKVTSKRAAAVAATKFRGTVTSTEAPELFIDATSGRGRLAWETQINGWAPDHQTPSRLHVVTDATTGAFIGSFDEIETIAGTGSSLHVGSVPVDTTQSGATYTMIDPSHGNGTTCDMNNGTSACTNFTDADNAWGTGTTASRQSAAVDAHYGAAKTFDYFKLVHGRNGIFGNGQGVPSRVHYGNNYDNAGWDGATMSYGDGPGNARPVISLDVAAHEMTHGVTENVVPGGLTYAEESGGLNEATSDIFGTAVEFYAANAADPGDYDMGEEINLNGDGTPLRYMYNPALDGASHSCWSTTTKTVNVHYSSGVANHFFFNLAEGTGTTPFGTSPVCGSAPAVTGITRAKAEKIWFRALDVYFTSSTSYVNTANPANTSRAYTLRAATDLYGSCSVEYKAVQAAWTSVNVAGNDATCSAGNDFSIAATPASGATNPGGSLTTTVSTALVNGSAQAVNLSASGLPAGVTASFSPASITVGGSATMTLATTASAAAGTYSVTITGTGTGATHTAAYALTVNGPAGCSATNTTAVAVRDLTTIESPVTISGCTGNASATSTVEVHITHTYIGDLAVSLIAPDTTAYVLHNRTGGSADNINQTYTTNLSSEVANGTWKLRVNDSANGDIGTLTSWKLTLGGGTTPPPPPPPGCTGTNGTNVAITDNATVNSTIAIAGCTGNASATSTVEVHIIHTYIGDLVVSLIAPDGTAYVLHNRAGGGTDNINNTFTTNLSTEVRNGTWTLRVQDAAGGDTGSIDTWTLTL